MMGGGYLACASCHGPGAQGGAHVMMGMQMMDAPDIRWDSLAAKTKGGHGNEEVCHGEGEYNLEQFQMAVVEGNHPIGETLSQEVPGWDIDKRDLADLAEYLMTLE